MYIYILMPPPTQRARCSIKVQFQGTARPTIHGVVCQTDGCGRSDAPLPLVFFRSSPPFLQLFEGCNAAYPTKGSFKKTE